MAEQVAGEEDRAGQKSEIIDDIIWRYRMLRTFHQSKVAVPNREQLEGLGLGQLRVRKRAADDLNKQLARFAYAPGVGIWDKHGTEISAKSG